MVSTIPTVLIGYQCKRLVVRSASSHMFSGIGILLTGVILLVVDYSNVNGSKGTKETSFGDAMWMGICQGLSVFPGLSRLGLTMSAGLFCGLGRKFAVKYSLLMSIPAVLGAFFCGDGRVYFCSYDCWPGIYLCSWNDRGRDHRLSGDPFYA